MTDPICIYWAAPLFTQAEWQWNSSLRDELVKLQFEVILPQDGSVSMLDGKKPFDARALFDANIQGIQRANVVVAVLDQADPDSGTSWECGYAYGIGLPVIGVRSDLRVVGDDAEASLNLMLSRSCRELIRIPPNQRDDLSAVARQIAEAVRRVKETGG